MKGLSNYRQYINTWWWGKTITLVSTDGYSTVELQFDNSLPNIAVIKGLMVFTTRQREGYGTEMMNLCEHLAKKEGAKYLQLSANKEQDWLKDWYIRLGFTIVQIDEHEYTMLKVLDSPQKQWDNNIPSREVILNIWELGNYWKELTGNSVNTEYGSQLEYIQKHWKEGGYYNDIRSQKQWKPSDEQMLALQEAMNIVGILTIIGSKINSLYQDLKKL